jgi:hypothetical protein
LLCWPCFFPISCSILIIVKAIFTDRSRELSLRNSTW